LAAIFFHSVARCWCSAIPRQLPPVKGGGFFTEAEPDVMLTEVHRQAADNPIIRMSMTIREGGQIARGIYGESQVVGRTGWSLRSSPEPIRCWSA